MNSSLVIVPTFNEAENIAELLKFTTTEVPNVDVLVVDDSSPDGTGKIVERFSQHDPRVHLLTRPKKEGLALAYLDGFRWGLARNYQTLIEMDADFSHNPRDLHRFLEAIQTSDVVVGCRYMGGGGISGWPWIRQFVSRGGNLYAKIVLGMSYQDLTGGFNAWRRQVLEKIDITSIRSRGYAFQVELKYRAHQAGFQIRELPIIFENRKVGYSKMSGFVFWEAALRVLQMKRATL